MPADRADGEPRQLDLGFHSYADDTPRGPEAPDTPAAPFVGAWVVPEPQMQEPANRPAWPKIAVGAGVLCGVAAAVALGWPARSPDEAPPAAPARAPVAGEAPSIRVEVTAPPSLPIPPPPRPSQRLEVLPARVAEAPTAAAPAAPPPVAVAVAPPPAAPEAASVARDATTATPAPAPRRFNDCRDAPSPAMEMVCSDMRLAAADRRMKRAYAAALAAGAPEEELRLDQEDWLDIREQAARISRASVVNIYRQRIDELQAMADGRWER